MNKDSRIYVAGHRGLVGSAIVRALEARGYSNLLLATRTETDLREQEQVRKFFREQQPEYVILAAAKVGGILANDTYPVDFLYDNLMLEANVIHAAAQHNVKKLLFLGTSCIYPKHAKQPIKEEYLLTGPLEPTNEWYAIAKIAGIRLCQAYRKQHGLNFICGMPTNLYGPGDNFDLHTSHVLPALIRKIHEALTTGAKEVVLWGTGTPRREFLYVDDCADACLFLMDQYSEPAPINIGAASDLTIRELADAVQQVIGWQGTFVQDTSKPDGTPLKKLDTTRLSELGWQQSVALSTGIERTYASFTASLMQ